MWLTLLLALSPAVQQDLDDGAAAFAAGDNAGALVEWSLALSQAREEGDANAEVQALLRLSAANRALGRLSQAQDLTDMAEQAGADPGQVGIATGLVLLDQGKYRAAEKRFIKAFEHAQSTQQPTLAADAANNLGLARMDLGDHAGAEKALSAAISLHTSLGQDVGAADALNNRGVVRRRAGKLTQAQTDLEAAVLAFRGARSWGGEADALSNLGLVLQDLGQDEAAEALYQAALATARQRRDLSRQGALLQALGTLAHQREQGSEALKFYTAAEQAFQGAGQPERALGVALNRAALQANAAEYARIQSQAEKLGQWSVAASAALNAGALSGDEKALNTALKLAEEHALPEVAWRAHYLKGRALLESDPDAGIAELRWAVDRLERTRRTLEPGAAPAFVVRYEQVYQDLIDALLTQGDSLGAWVYAERLQLAGMDAPPVPTGEEAERYQGLLEQEAALSRSLTQAKALGQVERSAGLEQELAQLRVDFAATVDTLRATYPDFDQLVRVDPEDLEAVQADLDPGVAVLQPILFQDKLVLLIVRQDRLKAVEVQVDPADVKRALSRLTRSLRAQLIDDPEWTQGMSEDLGAWLIAPIAEDLRGVDTLVVSATGPFQQLPFGMLRHQDRWLIQDMAIASVTHVGSLRSRGPATPRFVLSGPDLLLIGNPDGSLAEAEAEVQAIAHRYPGATVVTGALSGREQFLELSDGKQALHLATHGVINPKRPTASYLVIGESKEQSGRLAYGEIPGLALTLRDTRLVVLSACESGLPVQAPDAPGDQVSVSIHGLSAQFRRAGVETLVGSLWKVDDTATRSLMEGFYGGLSQGDDIAQSLRGAQLAMIESEEQSHPWFWAGFTLVGDYR
ncbi:MAG: CHAT domain-containing protein [Cognaticolwellia sp.]|jgi:CHAT domain-containing protein